MTQRSLKPVQILRFFVQLLSFIFFPVSFALLLSQIKSLYLALIGKETLHFSRTFLPLLFTLTITILFGRFFCGWICAFGSFSEWLNFLGKKLFKKQIKISHRVDNLLKNLKYFVLGYLIVVVWTFSKDIFADPWDAFDSLVSLNFNIKAYYIPSLIALIAVTVASLFINRAYCRFFCPLGAIFAIASKLRMLFIKKEEQNCGNCKVCENSCPMGIDMQNPYKYKSECIQCARCIESCPRFNLAFNLINTRINPKYTFSAILAGIFSFASILSGYPAKFINLQKPPSTAIADLKSDLNGQKEEVQDISQTQEQNSVLEYNTKTNTSQDQNEQTQNSDKKISQQEQSQNSLNQNNSDTITKSEKQITDTQKSENIINSSDSKNQESSATKIKQENTDNTKNANTKPNDTNKITEKEQKDTLTDDSNINSTDTNSQVTTSQHSKSTNSTTYENQQISTDSSSDKKTSSQDNPAQNPSSAKIYKDGTYTGEGFGYRPGLVVQVTIKDDKIVDIQIVSHNETPSFAQIPFEVIPKEIIEAQSTDVDTISGATRTSYGIISAVEDALSKAKIENSETPQN